MRYKFRSSERNELKSKVRSVARRLYLMLKEGGGRKGPVRDFHLWSGLVKGLYMEPSSRPRAKEALNEVFPSTRQGVNAAGSDPGGRVESVGDTLARLFSIQCATAAVSFAVVDRIRPAGHGEENGEKALRRFLQGLPLEHAVSFAWRAAGEFEMGLKSVDADGWRSDLLGSIFHDTVSKKLRHAFGGYHTASPVARGLVGFALEEVDAHRCLESGPGRILDPGCGSGVFLVETYREINKRWKKSDALGKVWGFDLSPVDVFTARLNLASACESTWSEETIDQVCKGVRLNDSIMGRPFKGDDRKFDALIGNPPWVRWDVLSGDYRNEIRSLLNGRENLFGERGFLASLGGSNDDVLTVFTALASERYLAEGGVLAFLVKQSVFTNRTGAAFRSMGESGPRSQPLGWRQVHDLRALKGVFDTGDQQPGAVVAKLGCKPLKPLPLVVWEKPGKNPEFRKGWVDMLEPGRSGSPWIAGLKRETGTPSMATKEFPSGCDCRRNGENGFKAGFVGKNAYRDKIRHGLKHDAEGVYAVTILDKIGERLVVRPKGVSNNKGEEYEVESAWVHPYIKPRHVRRWKVRGWEYVVVPQKRAGEQNEETLRRHAPGVWKYLDAHRERLLKRKSRVYRNGPFYSVFGLGPYTWDIHRVVWSGLGNMTWFAYLQPVEDPFLGTRCAVVDTSCYSMTAQNEDEALYLVGILNNPVVSMHLSACGSGAKRPLSKTALARLAIPRYDPGDHGANSLIGIAQTLSQTGKSSVFGKDFSQERVFRNGEAKWRTLVETIMCGNSDKVK